MVIKLTRFSTWQQKSVDCFKGKEHIHVIGPETHYVLHSCYFLTRMFFWRSFLTWSFSTKSFSPLQGSNSV